MKAGSPGSFRFGFGFPSPSTGQHKATNDCQETMSKSNCTSANFF